MTKLRVCATWISVLLGAVSAFCWARAANIKIPHAAGPTADGTYADSSVGVKGVDLLRTVQAQSRWNAWAATAASVAAIAALVAQTVSAIAPS